VELDDGKTAAGMRSSCSELKTYVKEFLLGGKFLVSLGKCLENQNDKQIIQVIIYFYTIRKFFSL
jgi:hypothetical protein